jgi:RNA polymerase primary sigma factor
VVGFNFRYRLGGEGPTVESFRFRSTRTLSRGDILNFDAGLAALGKSGDDALVGAALNTKQGRASQTRIDVIVDGDAVYGTSDLNARLDGAILDLAGKTGDQGVATNGGAEFVVVAESWASEETLVRINPSKHFRGPVEIPPTSEEPSGATNLTKQEESHLVSAAAASSASAREELISAYLPLISAVGRRYGRSQTIDPAELRQEGVVGLLRALKRFDASRGTPFWGYASWWVRQAMQQLVAERTGPLMLSDRAQRQLARINAARLEHLKEHQVEPTTAELAAATGLGSGQVRNLIAAQRAPRGLDETARGDRAAIGDLTVDPEAEAEYEDVLDSIEIEEVRDLAALLSEREREVVFAHYGIGRPAMTRPAIGERLGISGERVRQIEERALQKLRAAASGRAQTDPQDPDS